MIYSILKSGGVDGTVFAFERKSRAELAAERAAQGGGAAGGGDDDDDDDDEDGKPKGLLAGVSRSNPNRNQKGEKMIKVKNLNTTEAADPEAGLNRKQR